MSHKTSQAEIPPWSENNVDFNDIPKERVNSERIGAWPNFMVQTA